MGGQLWEVIGGWGKNGILVREGKALASPEVEQRLATGALVRELELDHDRLRFQLLKGEGPASGWVSVEHKKRMLLVPVSSALLLIHGATSTGTQILENVGQLSGSAFEMEMHIAGITVVTPDSTVVPYTLFKGKHTEVWFDRVAMTYEAPEDVPGILRSVEQLDKEIDQLVSFGIPPERIGVAGMSMGGCMSLHLAYGAGRYAGKLGAVACLCSFLHKESYVDEVAARRFKTPNAAPSQPLYMAHGGADSIVDLKWGELTRERLAQAGVTVPDCVSVVADLEHMLCARIVDEVIKFIVMHIASCRTVIYKYAYESNKRPTFHMAVSTNDFKEFLPLAEDGSRSGIYKREVTLTDKNLAWFQLVVDQDWKKALYPKTKDANSGQGLLMGPDDKGHGLNWQISGRVGDTFEVILDTKQEDKHKHVTWKLLRRAPARPAKPARALKPAAAQG